MTAGLPAFEAAILRLVAAGPLRDSPRFLDDAAAQIGISSSDMQQALTALVEHGLLVVQDLVDEEADDLTGRHGRVFRLTLAGQRAVDAG